MTIFGEKKGSLEIPGTNYKQGAPDIPAPGAHLEQEVLKLKPRIPDTLVELVALYESFVSNPYWDAHGKVWTIGYGTTRYPDTGEPVRQGDPLVSRDKALDYMRADLASFAAMAERALAVPLTDDQFSAFVSILYNVGPGSANKDGIIRLKSGKPSTLLRKLNAGDYTGARAEFIKWHSPGSNVQKGLKRRRFAEQQVWDGTGPQVAFAKATQEFA